MKDIGDFRVIRSMDIFAKPSGEFARINDDDPQKQNTVIASEAKQSHAVQYFDIIRLLRHSVPGNDKSSDFLRGRQRFMVEKVPDDGRINKDIQKGSDH